MNPKNFRLRRTGGGLANFFDDREVSAELPPIDHAFGLTTFFIPLVKLRPWIQPDI